LTDRKAARTEDRKKTATSGYYYLLAR
jgi:hypothetical protein